MYTAQEAGVTLIGEDRLMVMAGAELVEWYQIHQTHGFHVSDAIPNSIVLYVTIPVQTHSATAVIAFLLEQVSSTGHITTQAAHTRGRC